jgi:hypothetical protein
LPSSTARLITTRRRRNFTWAIKASRFFSRGSKIWDAPSGSDESGFYDKKRGMNMLCGFCSARAMDSLFHFTTLGGRFLGPPLFACQIGTAAAADGAARAEIKY